MTTMKTNLAKISVQRSFCNCCAAKIKDALLRIQDISNVSLYPEEALVVFNFVRANEISKALNRLTDLGYPEEGEIVKNNSATPPCSCRELFATENSSMNDEEKQRKMTCPIAQKFPFKPQNSLSPTLVTT